MNYRNRYTGSQKEREAILKELGLRSATNTVKLSNGVRARARQLLCAERFAEGIEIGPQVRFVAERVDQHHGCLSMEFASH